MKTLQRISLLTVIFSLCLMIPAFAQNSQSQDNMAVSPVQNQDQNQSGNSANQSATPQNSNEGAVTPAVQDQQMDQQQDMDQQPDMNRPRQATPTNNMPAQTQTQALPAGKKTKIDGVIVRRDPDSLIVRMVGGGDAVVKLGNSTKVEERKSNPFRVAKKYNVTQLKRGLPIQAEGRTDSLGALVADKIRFTPEEYKVADAVDSQVTPVEGRVNSAETRLSASEANAQRLSGQIEELNGVANAARGSANNAQQTADMALDAVHTTNARISALDDYQVRNKAVIHFKVGSAVLSADAKKQLDELAQAAAGEKGYIIEVAGFASSDGNEAINRTLSRRRAEAVVDYLGGQHNIPLRRITMPFGYGEKNPVADNTSRTGREENRRVEVSILVSKGLTEQPAIPSHSTTPVPVNPGEARR